MSGTVTLGGEEWGIPDDLANDIAIQIKAAMENGTVAALEVLDRAARPVTVYFNGRTAVTAVVDLGTAPKPTEISD